VNRNVNKSGVKIRKSGNSYAYIILGRVFFDWRIVHTTFSEHVQIYDVLHYCDKYTSNTAAEIVVNRMT